MPQIPVQLPLRRAARRWLRSAGAALAAFLLVTCSTDSPVGPGRRGIGSLQVAPVFDAFARVAPLTLDNVRVIVVRAPAETLAVVPKPFNPNSNQLQLNIPIFLQSVSEDLLVTLELYSGSTLLFTGTRTLRVTQGSASPPDSIPVAYQGPGSQVASVLIAPRDTTVSFGAVLPYSVNALDGQAQPVAQYYVSWSTVGAPSGTTIDGSGRLTVPSQRDTFFVKVATPNGVVDSTSVIVAASPSALVKAGGDGQSALAGTALPQLLAVQVNGSDGLPVTGATVNFAAGIGGGTVDSATATSDAQGIARSGAVLGGTVGAQTFIASAAGLTSVTFNETATSATGSVTWTGVTDGNWSTASNWNPAGVPLATNDVIIPPGTPHNPGFNTNETIHDLTIQTGASLDLNDNDLTLTGNLDASGTVVGCCTETVRLTANATVRGNLSDVILDVPAGVVVTLSGTTTLTTNGSVSVTGELILNGHTLDIGLANGTLFTNVQTGVVTMTNAADLLIARDATFNGGDETGHLTAGIIRTQNLIGGGSVPSSFFASGTHKVVLGGPLTSLIGFAVPAGAQLQNLDVSTVTGTLTLFSNIKVAGQLISHPSATAPVIGASVTPKVITVTSVDVNGLGIDQNLLVIGAGPITQFDNVAFTGQAATATALTVANAGTAAASSFNGLSFAVVPTTGFYLAANDIDGATPNALTINMVGATPAAPSNTLFSTSNGAVINWPASGPRTWTGATSIDWFVPNNWSPAGVPTAADSVVIPAGPVNQPLVTNSGAAIKSLTVNAGATLSLNGFQLNVSGSVYADSPIAQPGFIVMNAVGQLRGSVPTLSIQSGAVVTAIGPVITTGNLQISGAGTNFILGGQSVTVNGSLTMAGLLTMTNPADLLIITANATFQGGNELGLLSAGILQIGGNLTQLASASPDAFHTSGTHLTVLTGGTPTLNFSTPGNVPGSSHFEQFRWTGGGTLSLASDVFAHGTFDGAPLLTGTIVSGDHLLQVGNLVSGGLTFNDTRLGLDGSAGGPIGLSNINFINMSTTANQITVTHPGNGGPFTFSNLSFATIPTTGLYLSATDLDGIAPFLTVDMVNPAPGTSGGFDAQLNGAVINWPAASPVTTWTGTTSTDWSTATNWSTGVVPTNANDVVIPSGTPNPPSVTVSCAAKSLTVNAGATLSIGAFNCQVGGDVFADGVISGSGAIQIATTAQLRGNVPNLILSGPVTVIGTTQVAGTATISSGDFIIGGHAVQLSGSLVTQGTGLVSMTNPLDTVLVSSVGSFGGGDETAHLTAGYLKIGGSFTQTSANSGASFAASGTHRTEMGAGAVRVINFATPGAGAGTSHFNDLIVNGAAGGINLAANTFVNGQLISHPTGATPVIGVVAAVKVLTVGGVDVSGLVVDQNVMTIGAGTITQFDNVAFTGQANGVTQLTVANAGSATPATFNGLSFAVTPTTGLYLAANDLDGAAPNALTINMVGATPAAPSPSLFSATNGAVINWPGAGPVKTWTGAAGTDWFNSGNWSPVGVPSASDSVVIGPATAAPTLTANVTTGSIVVTSGSPVLNGHTMTVARGFATSSSGTLTMQNPLDSLVVLGSVRFDGGDESSLLTAGIVLVSGNFSQLATTSTRSFAPSGSQVFGFNGTGVQFISFASPGPGLSGFHGLGISNPVGGLTLTTDVYISGGSAYVGAAPRVVHGGGHTIQFQQINVDGVTFDNALVNLTNGTFVNFDNNTFQNYAPTATVLTMSNPGAASPFTFNNLIFSVVPTTGFYLHADDNVADANVLTIDMAGANPGSGAPFIQTTGGAVVNWPSSGPVITWTGGAGTSDWNTATNWSPAVVPGAGDSVVIVASTTTPSLTTAISVGAVNVTSGTITVNGQIFSVARGFATTGSGTLTMTNAGGVVGVVGSVSFDGGSTVGLLTAGTIVVGGNFTVQQTTSPTAFQATGTHLTHFTNASGPQTIAMANPGPGVNHFGDVTVSGGSSLTLSGMPLFVAGTFTSTGAGTTVHGNGFHIQAATTAVQGLTLDNASLQILSTTAPASLLLDDVIFQNMNAASDQLEIILPGAATPYTLHNLVFSTTPVTGFYLFANDNVADANVLTIDLVNPNPATPGAFTATNGGALIHWPSAGPVITWTGAVSTDWSTAANWSPAQVPTSVDDVVIPPTTLKPAITSTCAAKSILVNSGGRIDLGTLNCQVSGNVTSNGIIAGTTGAIQIVSAGQIQGNFPNIIASAPVTVAGSTGLGSGNGNLTITGVGSSLTMNGHTLVMPGSLSVQGGGVLIMNNPADVLTVQNGAAFDGGSESGLLTAGTLTVFNSFSQAATSSATSFLASGTHLTVLGGQVVTVAFATPASSHFQELDVSGAGGTFALGSNVTAVGQLRSVVGGLNGPVVSGAGDTLKVGGADVSAVGTTVALTMDGVPLVLSGGTITSFSHVKFQNQNPLGIHLRVDNVGTPGTIVFSQLDFTTGLSAGGLYIQANDLDGATPSPLIIDVAASNPATGAGVSQANNGAVINWPPSGGIITWTGASSTDWFDAANWSGGIVPTGIDSVVIPAVSNQPALSNNAGVAGLTLQGGTTLDLTSFVMVVSSSLDNSGLITGVAGTAGITFVGTGQTIKGTIGVDVVIPGSYTMNGNVDVLSMALANGGSLTLGGHQLTTTAGFSTLNNGIVTMTNAGDVLKVGGSALFAGGDETGKLTAGLLQIAGDFNQGAFTVQTSFTASGTHLTQFNGTSLQTIAMQDTSLSFFHDLQLTNTAGVTVNSLLQVQGDLDIGAGTAISAANGAPFFPGFDVAGNVTTAATSSITADRLFVGGTLSAAGGFNVGQTIFKGIGQTAPSNLSYQELWAYGTVTMAPGPLTVTGLVVALPGASLTLSGTTAVGGNVLLGNLGGGNLKLNGQQVFVTGSLTVDGSATLTMQSANDSLVVGGTANFIGGSETGLMTAGVLELQGGLKQTAATSTTSFAPSGKHKTVLNSATAKLLDFGSPGAGAAGSHFQVLDLSGATGGASLTVNSIADSLISTNASAKLSGGGASLTVRRVQVSGLTIDAAPIVLDEQGAFSTENFSNVTFQNFTGGNNTILSVTGPGGSVAARPTVTTTNVNFPSLGIGANNLYVKLVSSNSATFVMTMTGSNQSPQAAGNGPSLSNPGNQASVNGAQILWP